jgi:TM2 domain-containing membrane protein YozV
MNIGGRVAVSRPIHPLMVLAIALVLPGVGQVVNGQPWRGLVFVFYTMLLGVITYLVAPSDASFIGRVAGGAFVYAISVLDAYQVAARRRHIAKTV